MLLHLGQNVIVFRTLLHLGSFITGPLQHSKLLISAFFCVSSSRSLFYSPLNNFNFFHTQGKDGRDGRDGINGNGMKVALDIKKE